MILALSVSMLVGMLIPAVITRITKKRTIIGIYYFHHTSYGLLTSLGSLLLILKDFSGGIYAMGAGLGIMVHHFFSEKNLRLFEKLR